ncbi:MAG: VWA domain-containing protein [Euryarchaeota archaeon]|nr:VWA domain-containing protein [Euryarchaeota archaeon]
MDIVSDTASYCAQFPEDNNRRIYQRIIDNCRQISNDVLKRDYYVSPTFEEMAYREYDGTGIIAIHRTQAEFCTRGRQMDAVIGRMRARSTPALHLAILFDNSDSMTAWARSEMLEQDIRPDSAPLILAKIAAIALLEGIRDAETRLFITFGSDVDVHSDIDHSALLAADGSGCCRLDLALAELLRMSWDIMSGERQLIILTSMPPDTGTGVLLDDIGIQEASLVYMRRMVRKGVRILYLPIFTQTDLVDTMIGAYTSRSFAQRVHELGIAVSLIGRTDTFVPALRSGIKQMLQHRV